MYMYIYVYVYIYIYIYIFIYIYIHKYIHICWYFINSYIYLNFNDLLIECSNVLVSFLIIVLPLINKVLIKFQRRDLFVHIGFCHLFCQQSFGLFCLEFADLKSLATTIFYFLLFLHFGAHRFKIKVKGTTLY